MNRSQQVLATAVLSLTGFASSPALGNVLTVAPSGANYTQIQTAVNAASDGDVIVISPGSYGGVTIDAKSLTLVKKASAANVDILGLTTVKNLSATQQVVLSGLRGFGQPSQAYAANEGAGLLVQNNGGKVRVEYCSFVGALGWWDNTHGPFPFPVVACYLNTPECKGRPGAVLLQNTAGVSFSACDLRGGRAANGAHSTIFECQDGYSTDGGDGLLVVSTVVALYDSTCTGGHGGNNGTSGGAGGAGCRTTTGTAQTGAFASGSTFMGGIGGDSWDTINLGGGAGGSGVFVGSGTGVHLLAHQAQGGTGGVACFGAGIPGANGATIAGSGSIFIDPDSRIRMVADRIARAGSVVDLRIEGTPGQEIDLLVSRAPTFQVLPSWRGALLAQPGKGSVVVTLGSIPSTGVLITRYMVPPLPAGVPAMNVFVQPYRVDPLLGPKLGTGSSLTLLH